MPLYYKSKKINKTPKNWLVVSVFVIGLLLVGAASYFLVGKITSKLKTKKFASGSTTAAATKTPTVTQKQTVCLDPGHGGTDIGATYGNINEKDINLTVTLAVRSILENSGYKVYMTRTDDSYVAKRDRAYYCNSVNASILVAIHHNVYPADTSTNYDTALYYKSNDKLLAESVLDSTSSGLNIPSEGIASFNDSELWLADMPATLSEAFFETDTNIYQQLQSANPVILETEAQGIASGIVNYFQHPDQIVTPPNTGNLNINVDQYSGD